MNDDKFQMDEESLAKVHEADAESPQKAEKEFSFWAILLVFLMGGFVFWGSIHLSHSLGKPRALAALESVAPQSPEELLKQFTAQGKQLYKANCQACHQTNGLGVSGSFPPLDGSKWVVGDAERMIKILLFGLEGVVKVKGVNYNGNMPSYGENGAGWSDRKIAAVATVVRQSWSNKAEAVTEEEVAKVRKATVGRSGHYTGDELLKENPLGR